LNEFGYYGVRGKEQKREMDYDLEHTEAKAGGMLFLARYKLQNFSPE